jgi:hypothetical protein
LLAVEVFEFVAVQHVLYVAVPDVYFEQYNVEEVQVVDYEIEEPFDLLYQHNKMLLDEQVMCDE